MRQAWCQPPARRVRCRRLAISTVRGETDPTPSGPRLAAPRVCRTRAEPHCTAAAACAFSARRIGRSTLLRGGARRHPCPCAHGADHRERCLLAGRRRKAVHRRFGPMGGPWGRWSRPRSREPGTPESDPPDEGKIASLTTPHTGATRYDAAPNRTDSTIASARAPAGGTSHRQGLVVSAPSAAARGLRSRLARGCVAAAGRELERR